MIRLRFIVPRSDTYSSDAAFELCGDLGGEMIDFSRPLPPGRTRLWPEAPARTGHLLEAHLVPRHLDGVGVDGHLEGVHLCEGHLRPALAVVVESPRYVFGRFRHAIRMFDGAGNVSADEPVEHAHTVNESPPIPRGLKRTGWEAASGRLRFALERVRFDAVSGS